MRLDNLCILVLGPESSGTRLVTRLLMAGGCYGGDDHGDQPFDGGIGSARVHPLAVWRRSVPHNREWPDIHNMVTDLRIAGYVVKAVVTTRNWLCTMPSQQHAGHVRNEQESLSNLRRAYPHIFSQLSEADVPYIMLHYDALVTLPTHTVGWLMAQFGLTKQSNVEIYDGNAKWC